MKFSRMLPRPLETFHSVDEKRPRITFTKYIRGILNVFVGRLLDPFFPEEYNFMARLLKKKKKRESLTLPPFLVVEKDKRRRGSKGASKTIEGKGREGGKENEEGEARSLLLSTMRETHPPPSKTNQP